MEKKGITKSVREYFEIFNSDSKLCKLAVRITRRLASKKHINKDLIVSKSNKYKNKPIQTQNELFIHESDLMLFQASYKSVIIDENSSQLTEIIIFHHLILNTPIHTFQRDHLKKITIHKELIQRTYLTLTNNQKAAIEQEPFGNNPTLRDNLLRLETVTQKYASGWSLNLTRPKINPIIEITLDNIPIHIATTSRLRSDVKKIYGGDGNVGFQVELGEYLDYEGTTKIHIKPVNAKLHTNNREDQHYKKFPTTLHGIHFKPPNKVADSTQKKNIISTPYPTTKSKISIIILNKNGGATLNRCIESIIKTANDLIFEIILIDHASTDNSISLINSIDDNRINIIKREKNFSFSESNNFAAKIASGEILLLVNNDIIFENGTINAITTVVENNILGIAGIKLWDLPQGPSTLFAKKKKVIQHLAVHFNFQDNKNLIEAYEMRQPIYGDYDKGIYISTCVTAAVLGIKKEEYWKIGGLDEEYIYGQEDVDLCLKYSKNYNKKIGTILDFGAYHARGLSRKKTPKETSNNSIKNRSLLQHKQSTYFREKTKYSLINSIGQLNSKPFTIAMIVSEVAFDTDKADFFTAKELGDAFERIGDYSVGYFSSIQEKSINVNGYDCIIVFIDGFNLERLANIGQNTIIIGWARNWFDRWASRPWIDRFDIIFSSSEFASKFLKNSIKREIQTLRIAASHDCIDAGQSLEKYTSDYCFTGSYFESPREITEYLKPENLNEYKFNLYGHNWEKHSNFYKYSLGPVHYSEIPNIYKSTKIVIDDANLATKKWGALNCRFFDALAAGALVITNNEIGVKEIINESPTFDSENSLSNSLKYYLNHPEERNRLAKALKQEILTHHRYEHRANQIVCALKDFNKKKRMAIKIGAPTFTKAVGWGDLYFARALKNAIESNSEYTVRIDCTDQWYCPQSKLDDVIVCLRGLERYIPNDTQVNILWIISHPDMVSVHEINQYDKIYVASKHYAKTLREFSKNETIEYLEQASDFHKISFDTNILNATPYHEVLFIGNSRGIYRDVVKLCVNNNIPVSVYGSGWEDFIPQNFIKGQFISNDLIPYFYRKAKFTLNDHWADMRDNGFISNRIWDVLAAGGRVVTDYVTGIEMYQDSNQLLSYQSEEDFLKIFLKNNNTTTHNLNSNIKNRFAFEDRAEKILNFIKTVDL